MSYKAFQIAVNRLMARLEMTARFYLDGYHGRFIACCDDGTQIIGNSISKKATIKTPTGRVYMAEI